MYGYQLIHQLKELSHDFFCLKEGTLYPVLYRLEDEEMVESQWTMPTGKEKSKKYYCITNLGKKNLLELKQLWFHFSKEVSEVLKDNEYE